MMNAYNEWLKTDGGKQFMSLFGEGGKFENVAVVFDVIDPDKFSSNADAGDQHLDIVDSKGEATDIEHGKTSNEARNAANGSKDGSYIRSTIRFGKGNYSDEASMADLIDSHTHESQHTIISLRSISKYSVYPTSRQQHEIMLNKNGDYYKTRNSSYWQMKKYWAPTYMLNREVYNKDPQKFVNERAHGFLSN